MKKLLFLLGVIWLAACKTGQQAAVYTPEQLVPTEKSLVWKISGNGLKSPSYLYGTIHLIPKKEYEMPETVRKALDQCKQVAFEIDMKELTNLRTQMSLMTKAFMAGNKTLKDLLSKEDYAFVKEKMAEKGLPGGMMERMKPMFLSTLLTNEEEGESAMGTGAMTSVEMELYKSAKRRKLATTGLETTAYQMAIFDSIPYQAQAKMLIDGLRSTETDGSGEDGQLGQMLKMYREQDINAMQAMIADEAKGMAQYEELLLKKRNRNWIAPMSRLMREKPTIFAVGAGHLGGEWGVVALLRKAGFRVEKAI
ncbi:MAG: TraB/GumN family protein [Saprospiraceae bacterium]|nr:TraB/GumN family protein [Saprospiraceae bacterium]